MNRTDVIEVMSLVAAHWSNWKMPSDEQQVDFLIGSWERVLVDVERDAAIVAVERFLTEDRDFAPNVGQLRRRAIDMTSPSHLPEVDAAWAEVCSEVRRVGTKRGMLHFPTDDVIDCVWSHPAVGEAAEAMGWIYLCNSTDEMADRAHFIRFYAAARERADRERVMPPSVAALTAAHAVPLPTVVHELATVHRLEES